MSNHKTLNAKVTHNPALDKKENIVFFKEKLERAKAKLAKVGIPEKWKTQVEF